MAGKMRLNLDERFLKNVLDTALINNFIADNSALIADVLNGKIGLQSSLGWRPVAANANQNLMARIGELAAEIREKADIFVLVGVGGSNRAAQSVIEGLRRNNGSRPRILYAGNNFSSQYLSELFAAMEGKSVYINIIAKDFNTLEPGIAFRMLRQKMRETYGEEYKERFILTGGFGPGQLDQLAEKEGFRFLPFPQRVGGRFSAFTAVGLLPIAVAGVDIQSFIEAAEKCESELLRQPFIENMAVRYAVIRHLLSQKGFHVENLAYFEPCLEYFGRWWLQLHGETEGKCQNAILPMLTSFSEDLHAIGQYIQEGRRFIFETVLDIRLSNPIPIPACDMQDGFAYLNGKNFDELNSAIVPSVLQAHFDGGIPVLSFSAESLDEAVLAELFTLNMYSTYLNAVLLGVEPFGQNGVEMYKKNLYSALGKFH